MVKISNLTDASSVNDADELPIVQGSTTKRLSFLELMSEVHSRKRWRPVPTTSYTATPASTSSITMSDTSLMAAGLPVKYTYNGTTYYGIVRSVSAGSSITIAGAALNTGNDLTALYVGTPEMVVQTDLFVSSTYADGTTTTLLATDMAAYFRWSLSDAYLVDFRGTQGTADSGTEPKVNVTIEGNAVSTNDSNNGIQLSTAGAWVENSAVAISTANYDIAYGEDVEVSVTAAGGSGDAEDLTLSLVFVLE